MKIRGCEMDMDLGWINSVLFCTILFCSVLFCSLTSGGRCLIIGVVGLQNLFA